MCDPLVGTGQRPRVCRHLCDSFFSACADEYFAFNAASGSISHQISRLMFCKQLFLQLCQDMRRGVAIACARMHLNMWTTICHQDFIAVLAGMLMPCASQGQQQALVCSRARDLAADGGELCALLGAPPGDDASLCWSGSEAPVVLDSCKAGGHNYATQCNIKIACHLVQHSLRSVTEVAQRQAAQKEFPASDWQVTRRVGRPAQHPRQPRGAARRRRAPRRAARGGRSRPRRGRSARRGQATPQRT